jgi:hypothetical protein
MGAIWSRIGAGDYPDTDEWVRGKVCIVTGSNSGLGYYTALYLARYSSSPPPSSLSAHARTRTHLTVCACGVCSLDHHRMGAHVILGTLRPCSVVHAAKLMANRESCTHTRAHTQRAAIWTRPRTPGGASWRRAGTTWWRSCRYLNPLSLTHTSSTHCGSCVCVRRSWT